MTERPVNHEASRGSLPSHACTPRPLALPVHGLYRPSRKPCVLHMAADRRGAHPSRAGRGDYSGSVLLSDVPLSLREA
jgi:hypothetical protein